MVQSRDGRLFPRSRPPPREGEPCRSRPGDSPRITWPGEFLPRNAPPLSPSKSKSPSSSPSPRHPASPGGVLSFDRSKKSTSQFRKTARTTQFDAPSGVQNFDFCRPRLVKTEGVIILSEHPDDSRANCLTLTPAGRSLVVEAISLVEAADATFFGALGSELTPFRTALQSLAEIE